MNGLQKKQMPSHYLVQGILVTLLWSGLHLSCTSTQTPAIPVSENFNKLSQQQSIEQAKIKQLMPYWERLDQPKALSTFIEKGELLQLHLAITKNKIWLHTTMAQAHYYQAEFHFRRYKTQAAMLKSYRKGLSHAQTALQLISQKNLQQKPYQQALLWYAINLTALAQQSSLGERILTIKERDNLWQYLFHHNDGKQSQLITLFHALNTYISHPEKQAQALETLQLLSAYPWTKWHICLFIYVPTQDVFAFRKTLQAKIINKQINSSAQMRMLLKYQQWLLEQEPVLFGRKTNSAIPKGTSPLRSNS